MKIAQQIHLSCLSIPIMLLLLAQFSLQSFAEESHDLKLEAFISHEGTDGYLNLQITNLGEKEVTILTENFSMISMGGRSGRHRIPAVDLCFTIIAFGSKDNLVEHKLIPSLPKLCPVTLRKAETAALGTKLDAEFMEIIIQNPDYVIPIKYTIDDEIAERFGLWHGTLEIQAKAKSLLQTDNAPTIESIGNYHNP